MAFAVGIDIGTSNCKVGLFSYPACDAVEINSFETSKIDANGFVEFDLAGILSAIDEQLEHYASVADGLIELISIASVGESGVLVQADGSYRPGSMIWFDDRGEEYISDLYRRGVAEDYYAETGIPAHSNYAIAKILWLRDHGCMLEGARWLPLADFVAWRFCGTMAQDASLASRTLCLDIKGHTSSTFILEDLGLPKNLFPPVAESGVSRGMVKEGLAGRLGLKKDCEVCVAGHDHMVGSVATGLRPDAEILNSTGTSEGLLAINRKPVLTKEAFSLRLSNGLYVRGGLYSFYASLPTAGYSFEWLAKAANKESSELFSLQGQLLDRYLEGGFEGHEVLFLPHLRGSGPPRRNIDAKACVYGITDASSFEEVVFGFYLSLCFELKNLYLCMYDRNEKPTLRVIGPAVKSPLWMQLKADAIGLTSIACEVREAVTKGAVMVAAEKRGEAPTPASGGRAYGTDPNRFMKLQILYEERYLPLYNLVADIES